MLREFIKVKAITRFYYGNPILLGNNTLKDLDEAIENNSAFLEQYNRPWSRTPLLSRDSHRAAMHPYQHPDMEKGFEVRVDKQLYLAIFEELYTRYSNGEKNLYSMFKTYYDKLKLFDQDGWMIRMHNFYDPWRDHDHYSEFWQNSKNFRRIISDSADLIENGWLDFQKQPRWGAQDKYVISRVAKMFASLSTLVAANTTILNIHYHKEQYTMPRHLADADAEYSLPSPSVDKMKNT
jgi:hypothetical protein